VSKCGATVIGITGSYGKTSVKDILHAFLSLKHKTLKTPESYNTPMGICKIIRRDLKPDYEFFVVEMGARRRGEIKELCELVQPDIGIITAIGPQHLETFGSLENISQTKYELIESLPAKGLSVLNGDDPICLEMGEKRIPEKKFLFGIDDGKERKYPKKENSYGFVKAKNISVGSQGSCFILETGGNEEEIKSPLLGYQNIYNILAATAVALHIGLTLQEIKTVVKDLKPTPHRLQLIRNPHGVLIIDDAFNSNPIGARMALDVLKSFKHGRKILVTPGFVELGEVEYEENKKLGEKAAQVCDYVIVVGKTGSKPLIAGLEKQGFSSGKTIEVQSLDKASKSLQTILKPNDVVLFENDLPDNYL
jgi:UDP-N-acetylmuramoyl-tripeptide--D-alanyl-D-alanine ligase